MFEGFAIKHSAFFEVIIYIYSTIKNDFYH